jgi:asparagine synthase (glutamine-hydrolysing)
VGFREAEHSELQYARLIAEKFHTQHTELLVSADDLMSYLPTLIRSSDGPVSEPSNIPIWLISKKASESVKMVLTGEGSDELLGGYPKHSAERFGAIWRSLIPTSLHKNVVEPVLGALPFRFHRVKTLAASIGLRSDEERFARWMGALTFAERDQFMAMHTKHRPIDELVFRHGKGRTALERILQFDQLSWLPDNLLERGDRMTMAASIEARMPFMDTVLAAFVSRLGDRWRIRGLSSKHILRLAMKDILPPEIIYRPKVGFRVPVAEWFRGPMREFMRDHLASRNSVTSGLYRESELMRVLDEHEQGVRNHEKLLWSLLNLELFQRQYGLSTSSTLGNAKPVESLVA